MDDPSSSRTNYIRTDSIRGGHRLLLMLLPLITLLACEEVERAPMPAFLKRNEMPIIHTRDVNSLVSDSGIVRYRLVAKEWLIYDRTSDPYWYFPEKLYVEKFDSIHKVEATIAADTAYYYSNRRLWKLIGDVKIVNIQQVKFSTEVLFWDQNGRRIYTDSMIYIDQPDRKMYGRGFESNEMFTRYSIREPYDGVFYINEEEEE